MQFLERFERKRILKLPLLALRYLIAHHRIKESGIRYLAFIFARPLNEPLQCSIHLIFRHSLRSGCHEFTSDILEIYVSIIALVKGCQCADEFVAGRHL